MFTRPLPNQITRHLFVGNCGPALGYTAEDILSIFQKFGNVEVSIPDETKSHVFVTYTSPTEAQTAKSNLDNQIIKGFECGQNRGLVIRFADVKQSQVSVHVPALMSVEKLGVKGLMLYKDFVTADEERKILFQLGINMRDPKCITYWDNDENWEWAAKRRVRHFGYKFEYESRNINPGKPLGQIPEYLLPLCEKIQNLESTPNLINQITVNEYPLGVGLSPHIDTHSAFTGAIISLSLGASSVMEFRLDGEQKPIFLPPRSLIVMSGESRYCWQHYIPHRKSDLIIDEKTNQERLVKREGKRISLTFRQARGYPCDCQYPRFCDSQLGALPPTRLAERKQIDDNRQYINQEKLGQGQKQGSGSEEGLQFEYWAETGTNLGEQINFGVEELHVSNQHLDKKTDQICQQQNSQGQNGTGIFQNAQSQKLDQNINNQLKGLTDIQEQQLILSEQYWLEADGGVDCKNSQIKVNQDVNQQNQFGIQSEQSQFNSNFDLEENYVHKVYNTIAPHFSSTRFAVWPKVREFIGNVPQGGIVADVGCGNGKYFAVRDDIIVIGSDRSAGLIETAIRRINGKQGLGMEHNNRYGPMKSDAFVCDGYNVPMRSSSADAVISIAVLHHVSGVQNRILMLEEMKRLVKIGGRVLVTVWALEQENPQKTIKKWIKMEDGPEGDYLVPWHLPFHRIEAGKIVEKQQQNSEDQVSVGEIDEKKGAIVFKRYYHLYRKGELEELVGQVQGVKIIESFFDTSNWCVIFQNTG